MLHKLYDWTLSLAVRKSAEIWLAVIAFIESSVFLVPADVVFLPMALARPARAYRYALIATLASTLGGIAGYFLGYFAYESVAVPILELYGKHESFEALRRCANGDTLLILLVTSGLAHLPPIKVVTILAGVVHISFVMVHRPAETNAALEPATVHTPGVDDVYVTAKVDVAVPVSAIGDALNGWLAIAPKVMV